MFFKTSNAKVTGIHSSRGRTAGRVLSGFDYEPRDGKFLYVAVRACTADVPNLNFDMLPDRELKTAYRSFIGSYVYLNHDNQSPSKARGAIIDAAYHTEDPDDKWVEILMEMDEERCPKLCSLIRSGDIDTVSMGCFLPGTMVTLPDGSTKPIEDVAAGDKVVTHLGNVGNVDIKMVHEHHGMVYEVRSYAQPRPMRITEEHPVWIRRPQRNAYDRVRERVEKNKGEHSHVCVCGREFGTHHALAAHLREAKKHDSLGGHGALPVFEGWVEAKDVEIGDYVLDPAISGCVDCDADLARLLGYYLAEGNFCYDGKRDLPDGVPCGVEWTFNEAEVDYHAEVAELVERLGYKPVGPYFKNGAATVRCNSPELAGIMLELGGKYSWGKRVSPEVMRWGVESQRLLLEAYFNGDAHWEVTENGRHFEFSTVSRVLAEQVFAMCVRCGIRCSEPKMRDYTGMYGGSIHRPIYSAQGNFDASSARSESLAYVDEKGMWRRVTGIRAFEYDGNVYNMSVGGDDSYVADGCAVHNCNVESTTCSVCGNTAEYPFQFCEHIQQKGRTFNGKLAYEICNGIEFFEESWVYDPADPTAYTQAIDKTAMRRMAAPGGNSSGTIKSYLNTLYRIYEKRFGDYLGDFEKKIKDWVKKVEDAAKERAKFRELDNKKELTELFSLEDENGYVPIRELAYDGKQNAQGQFTRVSVIEFTGPDGKKLYKTCKKTVKRNSDGGEEIVGDVTFDKRDYSSLDSAVQAGKDITRIDDYSNYEKFKVDGADDAPIDEDGGAASDDASNEDEGGAASDEVVEDKDGNLTKRCQGINTTDGERCKNMVIVQDESDDAYCPAHRKDAGVIVSRSVGERQCVRCRHVDENGHRCLRITSDSDYCWQHRKSRSAQRVVAVESFDVHMFQGWTYEEIIAWLDEAEDGTMISGIYDSYWGSEVRVRKESGYCSNYFAPEWAGGSPHDYKSYRSWWVVNGSERSPHEMSVTIRDVLIDKSKYYFTQNPLFAKRADSFATAPRVPDEVDLDSENIEACPLCGDPNFDGEFCDICGYEEPPEGFGDIDLEDADSYDEYEDDSESEQSGDIYDFEPEDVGVTDEDVREKADELAQSGQAADGEFGDEDGEPASGDDGWQAPEDEEVDSIEFDVDDEDLEVPEDEDEDVKKEKNSKSAYGFTDGIGLEPNRFKDVWISDDPAWSLENAWIEYSDGCTGHAYGNGEWEFVDSGSGKVIDGVALDINDAMAEVDMIHGKRAKGGVRCASTLNDIWNYCLNYHGISLNYCAKQLAEMYPDVEIIYLDDEKRALLQCDECFVELHWMNRARTGIIAVEADFEDWMGKLSSRVKRAALDDEQFAQLVDDVYYAVEDEADFDELYDIIDTCAYDAGLTLSTEDEDDVYETVLSLLGEHGIIASRRRGKVAGSWDWKPDDGFSGALTHYEGQFAYAIAPPYFYDGEGWYVQVFDLEDDDAMMYGELYDEFGPFDTEEQAKEGAEQLARRFGYTSL